MRNSGIVLVLTLATLACAGDPTELATHSSVEGGQALAVAAPQQSLLGQELAAARAATARYQDIGNAVADGYVDIDVVFQNMGHHYLKQDLLDDTFQPDRPEILVYAPQPGGRMRLVALEYAVPLAVAAQAPAGFSGATDLWNRDERFQLWTLHAWVWLDNPAGVFASHNQRVVL